MSGSPRKNLALGYFFNEPFVESCAPWAGRIAEVFFAWPGVLSCRPAPQYTDDLRARMLADLRWCRAQGIRLDTLFNCNCYGDLSISHELADMVSRVLEDMGENGLFPNVVTTTSPFIATVLRQRFPQVRIRASINLRSHGTIGFEAVSDLFDEFYISREWHRSLDYVRQVADWARRNGKAIGMQANSGCLRECPFQTFHDNLHGHNELAQNATGKDFGFTYFRCKTRYGRDKALEDIIRATWIRPEDIPLWEPYVSYIKLATRRIIRPSRILEAYASYSYDGNLLDLLDPVFTEQFAPRIIDNKRFPADWATSGIGTTCAANCTHCGRCREIFDRVCVEETPRP